MAVDGSRWQWRMAVPPRASAAREREHGHALEQLRRDVDVWVAAAADPLEEVALDQIWQHLERNVVLLSGRKVVALRYRVADFL